MRKIRKTSNIMVLNKGTVVDSLESNSPDNAPSIRSINEDLDRVKVSVEEPTNGEKVWIEAFSTANRFTDKNKTDNSWLQSNGTIGSSNDWYITDYIDISGASDITINANTTTATLGSSTSICFYDTNKTYISGVAYGDKFSINTSVPSNAKYVRATIRKTLTNVLITCNGSSSIKANVNGEYETIAYKNIYSESEVVIGEYMGKPLYRRVISGNLPNDTNFHAIQQNVSELINVGGTIQGRPWAYFINTTQKTTELDVVIVGTELDYRLRATDRLANQPYKLSLEYTKTTD